MKIGFWGEGPWAHDSLERLLRNDSFHVLFVVGRASVYDRTLENIAGKGNIPFFINFPGYQMNIVLAHGSVLMAASRQRTGEGHGNPAGKFVENMRHKTFSPFSCNILQGK